MDNLFIFEVIQMLGIKLPVEFRLRPVAKKTKDYRIKESAAWCETRCRKGIPYSFVIFVNMDICFQSQFHINDVIAHELVHAIMLENGSFNEKKHHDKKFQNTCNALEKNMRKKGFKIGKLYSPLTDTE